MRECARAARQWACERVYPVSNVIQSHRVPKASRERVTRQCRLLRCGRVEERADVKMAGVAGRFRFDIRARNLFAPAVGEEDARE